MIEEEKKSGSESPVDSNLSEEIQIKECCNMGKQGKLCTCQYDIYQIRPYTFEILRAIQPFFEIIALSNSTYYILEQILDQIELILNKPIIEMVIKQREEQKSGNLSARSNKSDDSSLSKRTIRQKKKRGNKPIQPKSFFQYMICNNNYTFIQEVNEHVENLFLMTGNRKKDNIFLISSNPFNIVLPKDCGFCVIPITKFLNSN